MIVILLFFLAFLTAATVNATGATAVTVLQPLNDQLPLVARIGLPYSWTISPFTFSAVEGPLNLTTSTLPGWLSFDATTQTFHGTPSAGDEGYPEITLTAHTALSSSSSSKFTICVTHMSPPTLRIPIEQQFVPDNNKSLSSVFFSRNNSALATANPALRIPPKWSFSVGLNSDTVLGYGGANIFYELRLTNGSELPKFMSFNSGTVTLDGVIPPAERISQPFVIPCILHASDQEGYTSTTLPFDLLIAEHELSRSEDSLPTINITISTPFAVTLSSAIDFSGFLVDNDPIQPSNISSLDIDVSNYSKWLRYDKASRTLSGTPGDDVTGTTPLLPVVLATTFNQTINTNVSLNLVQSYFVLPVLPSLHVSKGDRIQTTLTPWFSKSNSKPGFDGTNVTASFEPAAIASFFQFDEYTTNLTGTIPLDYQLESVTVSFTAYSHITHSTSHTSFTVYVASSTGNTKSLAPTSGNGVPDDPHKKLALVLSFGLVGGLCLLAGILAIIRRCTRVEDTAIVGEEGRRAWSEKDRRWYGLTASPNPTEVVVERHETLGTVHNPSSKPRGPRPNYPGLGLRRVSERSQQNTDSREQLVHSGIMKKKEFFARMKETMRQVSNKYARNPGVLLARPTIGNPTLVVPTRASETPQPEAIVQSSPSNPFDESFGRSRPGSTFMSGSPSNSTAEHSIPRRRADFAMPKNPGQVHFKDNPLARQASAGSVGGASYRSGKSGGSGGSSMEMAMGPPTRPRLVPFTSSTRVPAPDPDGGVFTGSRIASQRANVCKADDIEISAIKPSGTTDEISMGLHYIRSLGADHLAVNSEVGHGSSPALSNVRSSFTSLESSHMGSKSGTESSVTKVVVRAGEHFRFRVPVFSTFRIDGERCHVKLTSGQPLPRFIQTDLGGVATKGVLELSGEATFRDLGESSIGVYTEDGICLVCIVIEVVGKH